MGAPLLYAATLPQAKGEVLRDSTPPCPTYKGRALGGGIPPFEKGGLGGFKQAGNIHLPKIPLHPPFYPQGVRRWVPRCYAATLPQAKGEVLRDSTSLCPTYEGRAHGARYGASAMTELEPSVEQSVSSPLQGEEKLRCGIIKPQRSSASTYCHLS